MVVGNSGLLCMNSILWENWAISEAQIGEIPFAYITVNYSNIQDGYRGEGNIDDDPLFVDLDNDNFQLTEDSPCIDAGDPDSDPDPDGTRADMGAFFFPQQNIAVEPDTIFIETPGIIDSIAVTIHNIGLDTLQVDSQFITPEENTFTIGLGGGEFSLEPDSVHLIWIVFSPERQGQYEAVLTIESNDRDQGELEIPIIGNSLSVSDNGIDTPEGFRLLGAYPNPFNSMTTIRFSLPEASLARMSVFDIAGREVAVVVDGRYEAGKHTAVFDADRLPSGIYLVRLEAGGRSAYIKMVLVR